MHLIGWNIVHNRYKHEPLPLHKKTHNGLKESIKSTGPMRKNKRAHQSKADRCSQGLAQASVQFCDGCRTCQHQPRRRNASGNANLIWTSAGLWNESISSVLITHQCFLHYHTVAEKRNIKNNNKNVELNRSLLKHSLRAYSGLEGWSGTRALLFKVLQYFIRICSSNIAHL